MTLSDIIALSKAGYKRSEIQALIAEDKKQEPEPEPSTDNNEPETEDKPETEPDKNEPTKDEPDYRALYIESQKLLEQAQALNRQTNVPQQSGEDLQNMMNDLLY